MTCEPLTPPGLALACARYVNGTTLGARVGQLNPKWNEESTDAILDAQFAKAVELTGREFQVGLV